MSFRENQHMASLSEQEKHHTTPVSTYELIQHLPSYWPVWPNKKTPVAGALFVSFSDTGQWRWVQIVSVELPRQVVTYEAVKSFGFCCFSFSNQGDNGTVEPLCFKQIIDLCSLSPLLSPVLITWFFVKILCTEITKPQNISHYFIPLTICFNLVPTRIWPQAENLLWAAGDESN